MTAALERRLPRLGAAFLLGAFTTLIFAPFHIFPAGFVGFGGLLLLLGRCQRTASAFWTGWMFSWGHFIAGLYWIASAFLVEPEKFAWMIPFPVLGLPALLALFPAVAVVIAWRFAPAGPRRLLAFAAAWTLMEMARGWVLTGFPWNLAGHAFGLHHALMQPAAWIGVYGLSFLAVLAFAAPSLLTGNRRSPRWAVGSVAAVALVIAAGAARIGPVEAPDDDAVLVRIVQPNIAQRDKWRKDRIESNFELLLEMSRGFEGDLIVWPETAATFLLSRSPERVAAIASVTPVRGALVTGAPRIQQDSAGDRYFNSAIVITANRRIAGAADKHHLVPFGEYLPLRSLLQRFGLEQLAQGRGDFSSGKADAILEVPGLPPAAILICYEAIFPQRAARDAPVGWLLNLTNDGWFGELTGPDQHFAATRFRSVEQGLPMIRAAGTGISAVVDPYGRITASLPLARQGVIEARLPSALPSPPFADFGSIPVLLGALMILLAAAWRSQTLQAH